VGVVGVVVEEEEEETGRSVQGVVVIRYYLQGWRLACESERERECVCGSNLFGPRVMIA
jgi:hypothetical protein